MVHFVLLSGGGGTRLWPLSNTQTPKQFLELFDNGQGGRECLLQRACRLVCDSGVDGNIVVATAYDQIDSVRGIVGGAVSVCAEPCRRDTFPAIALACLYLRDVLEVDGGDAIVVCPVDHLTNGSFYDSALCAGRMAEEGGEALTLLGVEAVSAIEKYGYIVPECEDIVSRVCEFREKPSHEEAERLIARKALWNAGVFAFRLDWFIEIVLRLTGNDTYSRMLAEYAELKPISFDYAVTERECSIRVLRYAGPWSDVGTWDSLIEAIGPESIGDVIMGKGCDRTVAINTTGLPVVVSGVPDAVVVATPAGVLVTSMEYAASIRNLIMQVRQ